ncbi:hypothetical protein B0H12DRAFT_1239914 [Mycena haematopus]|nr:hypothetical protein B0H12DRAFT_1239914 [Mycena haematopus]
MSNNQRSSHKRKNKAPQLVVAATSTTETFRSADDRRQRTRIGVVSHTAGPSTTDDASAWYREDFATSQARMAQEFTYQLGDNSLSCEPDHIVEDGIQVVFPAVEKPATVRPMRAWYPHSDEYLAEQLRREGRGDTWVHARCASVRCNDPQRRCPNRACSEAAEYRCVDQACVGQAMFCASCIVAAHAQLPTHFIEHWTGTYFKRKRKGLKELGLRVQLNHPPGVVCAFRRSAPGDFVLYDLTGVHEIAVDYCGCRVEDGSDGGGEPLEERIQLLRACWWPATLTNPKTCATFAVLRLFQTLNCLGKLSAYDFLRGLEKCTNHDGLDKPPDRRKPFMDIVRQWRDVKRMKRFKCGHEAGGVRATPQGGLALKCRACPQPGWNLPDDWDQIEPIFIYWLFLAQDANFRLSNRNVSSEALDPILGDGFGYFAKREGEDGYKAHIAKHASEQEVSNCSGFQAMFMANTRRVKGLRTTGIGGVTCSRHNMWQGNGIGDLQVGERYCNMDFLLVSVLCGFYLLCVIVSYDIACQYAPAYYGRSLTFTFPLTSRLSRAVFVSFHVGSGDDARRGGGAELGIFERRGGVDEADGAGSRQATLEDVFGYHNYDRVLAMHRVLPKRLAVSIKEGVKHQAAFEAFSKGLEESRPEEVKKWKEESDLRSPFESVQEVTLLRDIQLQIAQEEFICTEDGVEIDREHSPGGFITMGLELEAVQRAGKLAFTKRRTALLKRIHAFRQRQVYDGNGDQHPEATRLFMPSELSAHIRRGACATGLLEIEARMREGEAAQALEAVRHGLRTRTMTNRYKLRNYTGQGMMTKGQGILRHINIKIHEAKLQYRYARAALLVLRGHGAWEERLRVLGDDDVRALNERALTVEEKAQNEHWAELGGHSWRAEWPVRVRWLQEKDHIHFRGSGIPLDGRQTKRLKASRRTAPRVVQSLRSRQTAVGGRALAATMGGAHGGGAAGVRPRLTEGRWAYAAEHAATERATCALLERNWAGILAKADTYLDGTAALDAESIVTIEMEFGDELEPEEEEARLEGDE